MFHSEQLALDAALLLTEVESCALSPSTAVVLQASFAYSVTAAAHTRSPCQRLDMAARVLFFLNCNTCVYTCLLQVENVHLLDVVEGQTPFQQPLCKSDSASDAACDLQVWHACISAAVGHKFLELVDHTINQIGAA